MLNNFPNGDDPTQNSYGLFDNSGNPKYTAQALRALSDTFAHTNPGAFSSLRSEDNSAAAYSYASRQTVVAGGKVYTGTNILYSASAPSEVVMSVYSNTANLFATDVSTT